MNKAQTEFHKTEESDEASSMAQAARKLHPSRLREMISFLDSLLDQTGSRGTQGVAEPQEDAP